MTSISFKVEGLKQLELMAAAIGPDVLQKAKKGGIQYATKAAQTLIAKDIGKTYNLTAARIKKDISQPSFASDGSSASIKFSRRPPTLTQYGAKPGKRGHQSGLGRGLGWAKPKPAGRLLTAAVIRGNRRPVAGVFLITGNNGNLVAVQRDKGKLKAVYGPSIGSIVAGHSKIADQLKINLQLRINEQFIKGFERVLNSAKRGYG